METDVIDAQTRGRDYHNEIRAERDDLRAEVERLTRDRDYWQNIRARPAERELAAAERKLALAKEALKPFAGLRAARLMTDGCKYDFRLDVAWIRKASATLAALEKNDG